MLLAYNMIYTDYSSNIHGTLHSLEGSYGNNSDGVFAKIDKYPGDGFVATIADVMCLCLFRSIESISKLCDIKSTGRHAKFAKEVDKCREMAGQHLEDITEIGMQ